ncbi:uncharacterized protein EI90DRAFT_3157847 [Cantharellus anzutake]|uniref:uncharacterized protein n=1 Tax=Cantharellus anzutake TaxID=1750568 RepID=UPI00190435FF|nr:uncharacterized protein EI90DRAFT_3157847 [Cantharellus anzutake]KAF8321885.1 hypothetical protein EI90DRAFT_3157847 [Cantharellus anzutake]
MVSREMANHSNSVVVKSHGLSECAVQEFGTVVDLVYDALRDFRPPSGSIFQVVAPNLQAFDAWRKGIKPRLHLCLSAPIPTFKTTVAREMFPLITSSILIVRAHWAHSDGTATDLMPLDISPFRHKDRRNVRYWSSKIPERIVALRERSPRYLDITSQSFPLGNTAPTARELKDRASRLENTSQQLRTISHIYYCAAALREMRELGPEKFFERCLHASSERHSSGSPLIMSLLISPLVLLFDTTLTSPSILPSITAMVSYAVLHGGLRQSNGPRKVLENALLNLVISVSQTGQMSQHDVNKFHTAWEMILPYIPDTIAPVTDPPDIDPRGIENESASTAPHSTGQASGTHPSMTQSSAAAEISAIAPTPTVAHSTLPTVRPQLAPHAPNDRDEESTRGQKESQQYPPATQVSSFAGQKRHGGWRFDCHRQNRKRARKRIISGTGYIHEAYETEGTIASIPSLDICKTWPHIDKMPDVPDLNADARSDARSKLLYPIDLHVSSLVDRAEGRISQVETFSFPHRAHSPSLQKLKHFLESPQHDAKDWKPILMTTQQALVMDAQRFQSMVNDGTPIVLADQPMQTPFCADSLIDLNPEVQCIDSDHIPSADHDHPRMAASQAFDEICDWQRSRPLILTQASAGHISLTESLLNTHDAAIAYFPLRHLGFQNWRYLIVAAAGSVNPPHQGTSGTGITLRCANGYAIFFVPILKPDQFIMSCFNGADTSPNPDFSYLYKAPYHFGSFVLSPGQTVIFPPGQVYAYASLSREVNNILIPGCIMHGSDFLAAGCMKRSFFTSWMHCSAKQSKSQVAWKPDITPSLMAMVWNAVCAVSTAQEQPIHSPDIVNLCSLAFMAMEFIGDYDPHFSEMAKSLWRYCAEQRLDACSQFLNEFSHVKNHQLCV